jgi:hypothetical protein
MGTTALRPIKIQKDKDSEAVWLQAGDEVPTWAEKQIDDEFLDKTHTSAAGMNLNDDPIYRVAFETLEALGVVPDPHFSADQLAAMVRHKVQHEGILEGLPEGSDERDEAEDAMDQDMGVMERLFAESNASGNVNAPDLDEEPEKPARGGQGPGGSNS